jgi:hypothetical protein
MDLDDLDLFLIGLDDDAFDLFMANFGCIFTPEEIIAGGWLVA